MRVGIVNDMRLATEALRRVVCSHPDHAIAWTAVNGEEAVRLCQQDRPDVVLMDLIMPGMNGAEATRQIMRRSPCPILVVTATVAGNYSLVCEALGHGAYDAVSTPVLGDLPPHQAGAALLAKLARVDTIRRRLEGQPASPAGSVAQPKRPRIAPGGFPPIVALGASTGGPQAIRAILSKWPADFPAAVLVVQHIGADFAESLASWLAQDCRLDVRTACDGDRPKAGTVLVAGTDDHLAMTPEGSLAYTSEPIDNPFRPSVNVLFQGLARYWPRGGAAALLTGIGRDGAQGLLELRRAGWHTIAQLGSTCVVDGMPQAARQLGAAMEVLDVQEIAESVLRHVVRRSPAP
jgi:two-component system, chemotaxis family, response regulator WspF